MTSPSASSAGRLAVAIGALSLAVVAWLAVNAGTRMPPPLAAAVGLFLVVGLGGGLRFVGDRIPGLGAFGGAPLLSLLLPSALVTCGFLPPPAIDAVAAAMQSSLLVNAYLSCLVVSCLDGIARNGFPRGILRLVSLLALAAAAACLCGVGVGLLLGFPPYYTVFFILVPLMSGGLADGLPFLAREYAECGLFGDASVAVLPILLPAALNGTVLSVLMAGLLGTFFRRPIPPAAGPAELGAACVAGRRARFAGDIARSDWLSLIVLAAVVGVGSMLGPYPAIPVPILFIALIAVLRAAGVLSGAAGARLAHCCGVLALRLTCPVLVGAGILHLPWPDLLKALTPAYLAVCVTAVAVMAAVGAIGGRALRLDPVATALVMTAQCGPGEVGVVASLSAARRLALIPYAIALSQLAIVLIAAAVAAACHLS